MITLNMHIVAAHASCKLFVLVALWSARLAMSPFRATFLNIQRNELLTYRSCGHLRVLFAGGGNKQAMPAI